MTFETKNSEIDIKRTKRIFNIAKLSNFHWVRVIAMLNGIQLWKTKAPDIFEIARVSLSSLIHKTLLTVSGSSVAKGITIRLNKNGFILKISEKYWIFKTKKWEEIISKRIENKICIHIIIFSFFKKANSFANFKSEICSHSEHPAFSIVLLK